MQTTAAGTTVAGITKEGTTAVGTSATGTTAADTTAAGTTVAGTTQAGTTAAAITQPGTIQATEFFINNLLNKLSSQSASLCINTFPSLKSKFEKAEAKDVIANTGNLYIFKCSHFF